MNKKSILLLATAIFLVTNVESVSVNNQFSLKQLCSKDFFLLKLGYTERLPAYVENCARHMHHSNQS